MLNSYLWSFNGFFCSNTPIRELSVFIKSVPLTYGVSLDTLYISNILSLPWYKWGTGCVGEKLGLTCVRIITVFWITYFRCIFRLLIGRSCIITWKRFNLLDWQDQISYYNMDATRSYLETSAIAIVTCIASYIIVLFRLADL